MASISNQRLTPIFFVVIVGLIALYVLGALLGLGLMFVGLALVLRMSAKWKFAFLIVGAILLVFALIGWLF